MYAIGAPAARCGPTFPRRAAVHANVRICNGRSSTIPARTMPGAAARQSSCELLRGPNLQQMDWIMSQAAITITQLFEDYQTADAEKKRVYALAEEAADCEGEAAEASCDAAYDAV